MKKYFFIITFIISFALSSHAYATVVNNSGFVPGQIWYSKRELIEGDTVDIHTALWNGEKTPLSLKVEFYDKNVILGSRDVILKPSELKDVSVSWKITAGDHTISAKIISSTSVISGKKENVVIDRSETSNDKKFVPVTIKKSDDRGTSDNEIVQDQINKMTNEVNSILPEKVNDSLSSGVDSVDGFRTEVLSNIIRAESNAKNTLDELKKKEANMTVEESKNDKQNVEDATKKPITHVKIFLLAVLFFIFSHKIVFYGILTLIAFYIIRFLYRKIINR